MEKLQNETSRTYYNPTLAEVEELIDNNRDLLFQYKGKDYFLGTQGEGWAIVDPRIGHENDDPEDYPYFVDMCHNETFSPKGLKALAFLDDKTIFERFDELHFFD